MLKKIEDLQQHFDLKKRIKNVTVFSLHPLSKASRGFLLIPGSMKSFLDVQVQKSPHQGYFKTTIKANSEHAIKQSNNKQNGIEHPRFMLSSKFTLSKIKYGCIWFRSSQSSSIIQVHVPCYYCK